MASGLKGLAKVAAVNCDEETNKPFCGSMGVQGFPTLKIVRPGKKPGRPIVDDYQGARTAKEMTEAVVGKIKNHVKRLQDEDVEQWLKEDNSTAKAILFSEKPTVGALLKSIAIDFLGSIKVAQIRRHQKKQLEYFGVDDNVPKLLLLPGGDKAGIVYDGLMKKENIVEFLSQIAPPNPDPAPAKSKASKDSKKDTDKSSKASSSFSKASESHASSEASSAAASAAKESVEDTEPLESPGPKVDTQKPIEVPAPETPPELKTLETFESLQDRCLTKKSALCFLVLLPRKETPAAADTPTAVAALKSLAEIRQKHEERSGKAALHIFAVSGANELGQELRSKPADEVEVIAFNGKREWIKRYTGDSFDHVPVETWVDLIRMGEGKKEMLSQELEKHVIDEPKNPIVDKTSGQKPIEINIEDLMSGKMGEDSPLKMEFMEQLKDEHHDEL